MKMRCSARAQVVQIGARDLALRAQKALTQDAHRGQTRGRRELSGIGRLQKRIRQAQLAPAQALPNQREAIAQARDRGAVDAHHVVAPTCAAVVERQPIVGDVDAAGEARFTVDDQDFPVIAACQPGQPEALLPRRDRVELDHLRARALELCEHLVARADRAHGVEDDRHLDASLCSRAERRRELSTDRVRSEPIHLEQDLLLGRSNRGQHFRVRGRAVAQQAQLVALDEMFAGIGNGRELGIGHAARSLTRPMALCRTA